jgi:hypothetical protein
MAKPCKCHHGYHVPGCRGFIEPKPIADECDDRFGCAKLNSKKGDCGCSNDANQSKQERIAREHLRLYNEWLERSGRDGREARSRDAVSGTALLRSTLEALERLLRDDYLNTESTIERYLTKVGRRVIRDMVQAQISDWIRRNDDPTELYSWNGSPVSVEVRVALQDWVEHGASAREQLSRTLRQFIDALDSTRNKGAK